MQNDKFVARKAREHVVIRQQRLDRVGHRRQHRIAGAMTIAVVDLLEARQIHKQHFKIGAGLRIGVAPGFERIEQAAPVHKSGQVVAVCQVGQLRLGAVYLRNIVQAEHKQIHILAQPQPADCRDQIRAVFQPNRIAGGIHSVRSGKGTKALRRFSVKARLAVSRILHVQNSPRLLIQIQRVEVFVHYQYGAVAAVKHTPALRRLGKAGKIQPAQLRPIPQREHQRRHTAQRRQQIGKARQYVDRRCSDSQRNHIQHREAAREPVGRGHAHAAPPFEHPVHGRAKADGKTEHVQHRPNRRPVHIRPAETGAALHQIHRICRRRDGHKPQRKQRGKQPVARLEPRGNALFHARQARIIGGRGRDKAAPAECTEPVPQKGAVLIRRHEEKAVAEAPPRQAKHHGRYHADLPVAALTHAVLICKCDNDAGCQQRQS